MIPLWDLLNHQPAASVKWTSTPTSKDVLLQITCVGHFFLFFFYVGVIISSPMPPRTRRSIPMGSEVFNNYGSKSNEEMLLSYGFCLKDYIFDSVSKLDTFCKNQSSHHMIKP